MPCSVCSHTVQRVSETYFWCPRCGTLASESSVPNFEAPMIVERVKRMIAAFERGETQVPVWDQLVVTLRETVGLPLRPARTPVPGDQEELVPEGSSGDSEAGSE